MAHKAEGKRFNARSYTAEDVRAVVNILINFAEENAVFLPGRVPGYKSPDVKPGVLCGPCCALFL